VQFNHRIRLALAQGGRYPALIGSEFSKFSYSFCLRLNQFGDPLYCRAPNP
jgi:hypothetical protein